MSEGFPQQLANWVNVSTIVLSARKFSLLFISDIHEFLELQEIADDSGAFAKAGLHAANSGRPHYGGLECLAVSLIRRVEEERALGRAVLLANAGDLCTGGFLSEPTGGTAGIRCWDAVVESCALRPAEDASFICVGNHEFDHGPDQFKACVNFSRSPYCSSNVVFGEYLPTKSLEGGSLSIHFVTTDELVHHAADNRTVGYLTTNSTLVDELVEQVQADKAKVHLFVTHCSDHFDDLIAKRCGVRVIIGGHSHRHLDSLPLLKTKPFARQFGLLRFEIDAKGELVCEDPLFFHMNNPERHSGVSRVLKEIGEEVSKDCPAFFEVICTNSNRLHVDGIRRRQTALGHFAAWLVAKAAASLGFPGTLHGAFVNAGNIRWGMPLEIRVGDVENCFPKKWSFKIEVVSIPRSSLAALFRIMVESAGDPSAGAGFLQFFGVQYTVSSTTLKYSVRAAAGTDTVNFATISYLGSEGNHGFDALLGKSQAKVVGLGPRGLADVAVDLLRRGDFDFYPGFEEQSFSVSNDQDWHDLKSLGGSGVYEEVPWRRVL